MNFKTKQSNKYEFPVIIEKDESDYYFAQIPTLRGCHTQAKTLPALYKRLDEVIKLCLEVAEEQEENLFSPYEFVGFQKLEISKPKFKYA